MKPQDPTPTPITSCGSARGHPRARPAPGHSTEPAPSPAPAQAAGVGPTRLPAGQALGEPLSALDGPLLPAASLHWTPVPEGSVATAPPGPESGRPTGGAQAVPVRAAGGPGARGPGPTAVFAAGALGTTGQRSPWSLVPPSRLADTPTAPSASSSRLPGPPPAPGGHTCTHQQPAVEGCSASGTFSSPDRLCAPSATP